MAVEGGLRFERSDAADIEVDVVGERGGSPVMPLLTPGSVRSASATRVMPWRSSSSVLTVLVNVLDCCSESLARADVTAMTCRSLVPRLHRQRGLDGCAADLDRLRNGRLVVVDGSERGVPADRNRVEHEVPR